VGWLVLQLVFSNGNILAVFQGRVPLLRAR
jgi:hypothetical protein